jgi:4-alpha-glucanotransferase
MQRSNTATLKPLARPVMREVSSFTRNASAVTNVPDLKGKEGVEHRFHFDRRSVGLLMHPTSLPGPLGSGDVGKEAYAFADFLASAGVTWWQMLPVGPPGIGPGYSPYSSWSSFAGSPYLIDLRELARDGLLEKSDVKPIKGMSAGKVNFKLVHAFREEKLHKAYRAFEKLKDERHAVFAAYTVGNASWLDDFSLFAALKSHYHDKCWTKWDKDIRTRKPEAIRAAKEKLASQVRYHKFVQFVFDTQWANLRKYCNGKNIGLIGDIPIFVAHDSADCWAHPHLFALDRNGEPKFVSGYPPDGFSPNGQRWGHPQYHWPSHAKENYKCWVDRFSASFKRFDAVRIDHFLGFDRLWQIPASAPTAATGKWIPTPGAELFKTLIEAIGDAPIIAEDLGLLIPSAEKLRDRFKFPGMKIMQFGFGDAYHLPHRHGRRFVIYTGTHDNETIVGYFDNMKKGARKNKEQARQLAKAKSYLGTDLSEVHWDMMRVGMMSCADTAIFPVQDLLGLDNKHRMNIPGTEEGNWHWRLPAGRLTTELAAKFRSLVETFDRVARASRT